MNQQRIQDLHDLQAVAAPVAKLGEVTSERLFASVTQWMSNETYQAVVKQLVAIRWVRKLGDIIFWCGPDLTS